MEATTWEKTKHTRAHTKGKKSRLAPVGSGRGTPLAAQANSCIAARKTLLLASVIARALGGLRL